MHRSDPSLSPAEGHGAEGVAPLVLEQAGAELREAAEEEAKRDGHLGGALGLRQLRLGALQQRRGQRKAVETQGRCGRGRGREGRAGVTKGGRAGSSGCGGGVPNASCMRPCRAADARNLLLL